MTVRLAVGSSIGSDDAGSVPAASAACAPASNVSLASLHDEARSAHESVSSPEPHSGPAPRSFAGAAPGSSAGAGPRLAEAAALRTVLVVDDDPNVAEAHCALLERLGHRVVVETDSTKVISRLLEIPGIELVLLDMRMPKMSGLEVLAQVKLRAPQVGVVMATVVSDMEEAVKATRSGAYNYLLKPLQADRLERVLTSFFVNQPKRLSRDPRFNLVVTQSPLFEDVFHRVAAFASADVPVLIQGETGTGKELIAQLLHNVSPRREGPFVAVNVAALSAQLFESELFGHRRGAFTGAVRDHEGYLSQAAGGTIFLDEIGELPAEQQKKLLRVLQTGRFAKVGEVHEQPLEARVVLATNRDLLAEAQRDGFRADLYYRFASHSIKIPPLRLRQGDIELLAEYFLQKACSQYGRSIRGFSAEALEMLKRHSFPGNVRELEGCVNAAVLLEQSQWITPSVLPEHYHALPSTAGDDLESVRLHQILKTLTECNGNQTRAAERLGISRGTLNRLLKEYRSRGAGLSSDSGRSA